MKPKRDEMKTIARRRINLRKSALAAIILLITLAGTLAMAQNQDRETTSPLAADLVSTTTPVQHPVRPLRDITPGNIGEFVAVEGMVAEFYPPPEPRAPYAILLKDAQGDTMRIVMWQDIYERVDHHSALETTGTRVRATAEVAEYNNRIELHLADYEEMDVTPLAEGATRQASAPAAGNVTTSETAKATDMTMEESALVTSPTSTETAPSAAP